MAQTFSENAVQYLKTITHQTTGGTTNLAVPTDDSMSKLLLQIYQALDHTDNSSAGLPSQLKALERLNRGCEGLYWQKRLGMRDQRRFDPIWKLIQPQMMKQVS